MSNRPINSFVFVDFETGGLFSQKNAVTEVAMVAIKGDTLEKIDLLSTYVKPYNDTLTYEPEAMKFTGITAADIEGGETLDEVTNQMLELLKKCDFTPRNKGSKPVLIAHNSAFDKGFLLQLFSYAGKLGELEKVCYGAKDFFGNWQPEMLDSVLFFKMAFGADEDITNFKLSSCLTKAGVDLSDAHKAVNDTLSLKEGVVKYIHKLRSSGLSVTGLGELKQSFRDHFQF